MRGTIRLLAVALLAGCTSYGATNSPVTDENAVMPQEVVGKWLSVGQFPSDAFGGDSVCLAISAVKAGVFGATMGGCRGNPQSHLQVQFARLAGELVASAQQATSDTALAGSDDALLLYEFYRLRIQEDSLFVAVLDADSLRSFVVNHPAALPFALLEGNGPDLLLTATPEQLQAFFATHALDSSLWGGDSAQLGWKRLR
jgi:hypothetical protein